MDQKRLARDQSKLLGDFEPARQRLLQLPNVVAVGIGLKETGGEFTEELSYRVYVTEKKDPAALRDDELVPPEMGGFRTDVLTPLPVDPASDPCGDERRTLKKHRPLQAGIAISTDSTSYGTLGWFGQLDADDTPVLLTNKHVVYDATIGVDTSKKKTAQPQLGEPSKCCCCECGDDNVIGETIIGIDDTDPLTETSVDAAIAKIDSAHATDIVRRITNASTEEVLEVQGTAAAVVGQAVRKIGARSAFTRGTVIHVGDVAVAPPADPGGGTIAVRPGQVLVIPIDTETYEVRRGGVCKRAFANNGDSGSVVVNGDDDIIALLWGVNHTSYTVGVTVASRIENVLAAFSSNGFPMSLWTSPPGGGASAVSRASGFQPPRAAPIEPSPDPNVFERLRDTNRDSLLAWLVERHYREVLELVNEHRPVTVTWHRHQGPAFVAALSRASRVDGYEIPQEIQGIGREGLLKAMEAALLAHGSARLRKDVDRYRDDLIAAAQRWSSLAEAACRLVELGLLDSVPEEVASPAG